MTGPFSRQPQWLAGFELPAAPTGAIIAIDFSPDGLWAARMEKGLSDVFAAAEFTVEQRIQPEVLDSRIAAYLRESGKVDAADPEVYAELVAVAGRARRSLVGRDAAVVMGGSRLQFVTLTIDDAIEATVPETNRAHGMIVELAGTDPVDAVLLGPGLKDWPGLPRALTERGFSPLTPGDVFPETFGGDDEPTTLLEAIEPPQQIRAWDNSDQNAALVDPADYGLDRFGNAVVDVYSDHEDTESSTDPERQPGMRGKMLAVAAILVVVGGGGVAVAMNAQEASSPGIASSVSSDPSKPAGTGSPTDEPERVNSSVDPADMSAAKAPMLKYTTPPPSKTTTRARSSEAQPAPPPPPPTRHRPRTIPNPIPGLPPIVIG